jgi:hypothetical protein
VVGTELHRRPVGSHGVAARRAIPLAIYLLDRFHSVKLKIEMAGAPVVNKFQFSLFYFHFAKVHIFFVIFNFQLPIFIFLRTFAFVCTLYNTMQHQ